MRLWSKSLADRKGLWTSLGRECPLCRDSYSKEGRGEERRKGIDTHEWSRHMSDLDTWVHLLLGAIGETNSETGGSGVDVWTIVHRFRRGWRPVGRRGDTGTRTIPDSTGKGLDRNNRSLTVEGSSVDPLLKTWCGFPRLPIVAKRRWGGTRVRTEMWTKSPSSFDESRREEVLSGTETSRLSLSSSPFSEDWWRSDNRSVQWSGTEGSASTSTLNSLVMDGFSEDDERYGKRTARGGFLHR